jgi:hypothetical protein
MPVSSHIRKESRKGGYCSLSNLMKLISPVTNGEWHEGDQITAKMLQENLNIHRAEVYLVQVAARSLLFLDKENCVTETLVRLAYAPEDEYQAILKECILHAYPDILNRFDGIDLAHVTSRELKQAFTDFNYEPSSRSLRPKVIALFKGLCRQAGLISDERTVDEDMMSQESSERIINTPSHVLPSNNVSLSNQEYKTMSESSPVPKMNGFLQAHSDYSMLEELLSSFEELHQELSHRTEWTEADRARWEKYLKINHTLLGEAIKLMKRAKE